MRLSNTKLSNLKALFWKEWHENIRWSVLILLCLACSLFYAVYYEVGRTLPSSSSAVPVWNNVTLIMTIGAPLAGLALGLLQILPELRRDQWAFLVHRPVSRTTLFVGKVLPGLCLYLLAVIPPLLSVTAWDAVPGHVAAPFDLRLTLGGWAAILTGPAFYFAGLLVAIRPARWYGSRPLPILAALMGIFAATWYFEFFQVTVACAVISGVLAFGAWGSFVSSGEYERQTKPARFILGVILYTGILICTAGIAGLSITVYEALFPLPARAFISTQYQIDLAGRIVRVTRDRNGNEIKKSDLAGHALPVSEGAGHSRVGEEYLSLFDLAESWSQNPAGARRYNNTTQYVLPLQTFLYQNSDTAWYYLAAENQMVGYSMQTRLRVGYLGPQGFSRSPEGAGRFSEPLSDTDHQNNTSALLQFPHAVYRFDTDQRTLTKLWSSTSGRPLEGVCYLYINNTPVQHYAVAADNRIQLFTGEGVRLLDLPRAFPASAYPGIQAAMDPAGSRYYFWYATRDDVVPVVGWGPSKIVTVASNGHVLRTIDLPRLLPARNQAGEPAMSGLLLPPALLPIYVGSLSVLHAVGYSGTEDSRRSLRQDKSLPGMMLFSLLSGLPAAVLAWLISRRCGDSLRGQILWAFGVFWLGLYGVLLLLALRAWPARVACPNCGHLRVVDRTHCEHCGAPFARPPRDGTEIFDEENVSEGNAVVR